MKTKAYAVGSKQSEIKVVVYAESNKKAKLVAYNNCLIGDIDNYIDLRATREHWADGLKKNGQWLNFCDNVKLFKSHGWYCVDHCLDLDCPENKEDK